MRPLADHLLLQEGYKLLTGQGEMKYVMCVKERRGSEVVQKYKFVFECSLV